MLWKRMIAQDPLNKRKDEDRVKNQPRAVEFALWLDLDMIMKTPIAKVRVLNLDCEARELIKSGF